MTAFGAYALYYDLFYSTKPYSAEADYVHLLLKRHCAKPHSVLDLGCGTAAHAVALAKRGFQVHGIDRSAEMIDRAKTRLKSLTPAEAGRITLSKGDLRDINLDRKFSVVTSLFHVISYLPGNLDLADAFSTVRRHLEPGGVFIFDFWYGPAVLTYLPEVRVRRAENDAVRVMRIAEPELIVNENLVRIHYEINVIDKCSGTVQQFGETHVLRYFFLPELDSMVRDAGLEPLGFYGWLSDAAPDTGTWYACMVVQG